MPSVSCLGQEVMMTMSRVEEIVAGYADKGIRIPQETVERLIRHCSRKMEVAKVENREEYLPLLFEDEIRNYLYRRSVNATTVLGMMGKEGKEDVFRLFPDPVPSAVP